MLKNTWEMRKRQNVSPLQKKRERITLRPYHQGTELY